MEYLKNYTTMIDATKTVGEIQELLAKSGAKQIMILYENGHPKGVCFSIQTSNGLQGIKLPVNVEKMYALLKKIKKQSPQKQIRDTYEQAERTAWRNVKEWISIQLSFIATEMVNLDEVFLPYLLNNQNKTIYELFTENQLLLGENK